MRHALITLFLVACSGETSDSQDSGTPDDTATSSGAACTFNDDCPASERCECDEATGCACATGPRGTGQSGVDTCESGNDCETSLCLEGPGDVLTCSGPCGGPEDCGGTLPVCAAIFGLGDVCIREGE